MNKFRLEIRRRCIDMRSMQLWNGMGKKRVREEGKYLFLGKS